MVRNLNGKLRASASYQEILNCIRFVREALKSNPSALHSTLDVDVDNKPLKVSRRQELESSLADLIAIRKKFIVNLRVENHEKIMSRVKNVVAANKSIGKDL